jgi:hypothetical protein
MRAFTVSVAVGAASAKSLLQANARGIACEEWTGGPNGGGTNCIWHTPPGSKQSQGSPWVGAVDPETAAVSAILGVTDSIGVQVSDVWSNFVAPDAATPSTVLAYTKTTPQTSYSLSLIDLPSANREKGDFKDVGRVLNFAPMWVERGLPHMKQPCMLGYQYVVVNSTGGSPQPL